MAKIYGINSSQRTLEKYTGAPWQIGSVRRMMFTEGPERDTEVVQVDNGCGLRFDVLPSRGLDVGAASFMGIPLAYLATAGEAHPAHYDPHSTGWLKTFAAGLLTTCGATWLGSPTTHNGEALGLHGRYAHLPARNVNTVSEWQGGRKCLRVSGEVREAHLFGPNVSVQRTLSTVVGEATLTIEDHVTNHGFVRTPHQWLYHFNIGFPLLSEYSELFISSFVLGRDENAQRHLDRCHRFEAPSPRVPEQVFYHEVRPDRKGEGHAMLVNPHLLGGEGVGLWLRYGTTTLNRFVQWKNMRSGMYVCGLEPANCWVEGRDVEEKAGRLQMLNPGETRRYSLSLRFLTGSPLRAIHKKHFPGQSYPYCNL